MKLPVSRNYNSILVVCDRFLKILHFIVITEKITAKGLAKLFRNNMWKLHGLLKSVISNKEPQFVTELMKKLNKILGIKTKLSIVKIVNNGLNFYFSLFTLFYLFFFFSFLFYF